MMLAAAFSAYAVTREFSYITSDYTDEYSHFIAFSATTTQATSTAVDIRHAEKAQVYFAQADGTGTATTTFHVEVSPNNTDWYDYNKLVSNVVNANNQQVTRVATVQQVGTTSALYGVDLEHDTFAYLRCIAVIASTTVNTVDNSTCEVSVKR